jgi:ABC-type phosphate/phosphonate transport system substrate-binding protein
MARGKRSSLFLQIILLLQLAGARELQECGSCIAPVEFLPDYHKSIYTIGVLAIQGAEAEASYDAYKPTFTDYLTATAGKRFDPPINFEMVDLDYQTMYDFTESQEIDFLFVSPSPSACLAAQYGTQSLASITKKAVKDGVTYNLSEFGGLIITQADNENINSVEDLRDKTVAAVSIAGFGSGLMQFYEMQKRGMSYINDPNALIFTSNQAHVVQGVLDGTFEAGFVRTGIIERALDADGNPVDASKLKIIESQQDLSDGAVYPYEHSTPLYPEWNIAALKQTSSDVAREVQAALLALSEHGRTGQALEACIAANDNDSAQCNDLKGIDPLARCDTTVESAKAAFRSLSDGMYAGWRTTLSYNEIRTLLEDTGFIQKDPVSNVWRCQPPSNLYDQIVCPPNFFKLSFDAYNASCPEAGLTCPDDYECVCRPCFEAAAIEISLQDTYKPGEGCPKMSVCGTLEQNDVITYTVADNLEAGLDLRVNVLEGSDERQVPVEAGSQTNTYSFSVSSTRVGIMILEIFNGEEQIEASPLRVNVAYRTCPSGGRANENGNCDCGSKTYSIGGKCVERWILYVGEYKWSTERVKRSNGPFARHFSHVLFSFRNLCALSYHWILCPVLVC